MNTPLAHSVNTHGRRHLLREHSEAVATLAEEFARLFGTSGYARCAGLWHDLGKNALGFQERLAKVADAHIEGATGYGDHTTAGALHALQTFGNGPALPLAFVIAGHHGGLSDFSDLFEGRLREPEKLVRLAAARANPDAFIPL